MPLLRLTSGRELHFIDEETVKANLQERGFENDTAFIQLGHSDLEPNQYEGGLKVWECTKILCDFIEDNAERFQGKSVLELGCGSALPAILSKEIGAEEVAAQDFNSSVIDCFTLDNVLANGLSKGSLKLMAASWVDLPGQLSNKSFDIVIASETIYNTSNYEAFHLAIDHSLKEDGVAWIVAKEFYFGLGGSAFVFLDFVKSKGIFKGEIIDPPRRGNDSEQGYAKVIIQLTRR
ncbi:unnamed protein product, partial [Mesorhabditis belari]|uniref:protein-histidine N-methyltransferase n=1 Tax=Mesorhabditis belari TaxID=2138241 RepID=A0AAF3EQ61_9BILA